MEAARLHRVLSRGLGTRLSFAGQVSIEYSVYPAAELTAAQTLVLALFGSLLEADVSATLSLLPAISAVPELQSSSISVWLREDFRFRRKDVARVLSSLAYFLQEHGPLLPLHVLVIFSGLEEKYDLFEFFREAGDTVSLEMLAYLNPLVTRATQVGPQLKDQSVDARPVTTNAETQTSKKDHKAKIISSNIVQKSAETPKKTIDEWKDSGPSRMTISLRTTSVASPSINKAPYEVIEESKPTPCTREFPVVYATSHSVESVPIETITEFRPEDLTAEHDGSTSQASTLADITAQNQIILADLRSSRPLPSAPSLDALYSEEPGYVTVPSTDEPIYENIEIFYKQVGEKSKQLAYPKTPGVKTEHKTDQVQSRTRNIQKAGVNLAMKNLLKAAERGDTATAAKSLAAGVSPDCKDSVRRTPLHLAVVNGQHLLVQLLLEAGAQKDVKDSLGRTPLHYSALKGRIDCTQILLENGANPNIRDNSGMTPTALATMKHHSGVAVLLKKKGGQECCIS